MNPTRKSRIVVWHAFIMQMTLFCWQRVRWHLRDFWRPVQISRRDIETNGKSGEKQNGECVWFRNFKLLGFTMGRNGIGIHIRPDFEAWDMIKSIFRECSIKIRAQNIREAMINSKYLKRMVKLLWHIWNFEFHHSYQWMALLLDTCAHLETVEEVEDENKKS